MTTTSLGKGRDLRLDFFRGLALMMIYIDHLPANPLSKVTLQGFAIADAAEAFVFISGCAAGIVYGRTLDQDGALRAASRSWSRAWRIYSAHIALFLVYTATTAAAAWYFKSQAYAASQGLSGMFCLSDRSMVSVLVLTCQPDMLGVLPLYTVLMLALPLALVLMRWHVGLALAPSLVLWALVQAFGLNLPTTGENHGWQFNPLSWQLLFVLGACLGYTRLRGTDVAAIRATWRPYLLWVAGLVALVSAAIQIYWTLQHANAGVHELFPHSMQWLFHKVRVGPARLISFLALATLALLLIPRNAAFLSSRFSRPFILCGQHSLLIFSLGLLLAQWMEIIFTFLSHNWIAVTMANIGGLALQIGVAWIISRQSMRQREARHSGADPGSRVEPARTFN